MSISRFLLGVIAFLFSLASFGFVVLVTSFLSDDTSVAGVGSLCAIGILLAFG